MMRRVGLTPLRVAASHRVELPHHLRVRFPRFRRGHVFHAIAAPQTIIVAKSRNAALSADARACKHEDTILYRDLDGCAHVSSVAEKHHETEIHMSLLMAVKKSHAWIECCEIDLGSAFRLHH